jgi:hypothetical protein
MSRLFGPMTQLGFVVPDIHEAMRWWTASAQIGPWFYIERSVLPEINYRGTIYRDPNLSSAFANSGGMQVELIQQNCKTPTVYLDFLSAHPSGGLHHWSSWPTPEQYDERMKAALAAGYVAEMQGGGPRGPFVYFSKAGVQDPMFEMAALVPPRVEFFDRVHDAAVDWDGAHPIRDRSGTPL